jgi:hypothetical protein
MRSTHPRSRRSLRLALIGTLLAVAVGSIAPAFGAPSVTPAKAFKLAQRALSLSKKAQSQSARAIANSTSALKAAHKPGPAGPQGARGSEGLDGPQGPDGDRGPRGVTGPTGAQGVAGTAGTDGAAGASGAPGATGAQGVSGTARAYATVLPSGTVVDGRTRNFTSTRPADDLFCLTPAAGINAGATSAVVSIDLDLSAGTIGNLFAAVDSSSADCAPDDVEVKTAGPAPNAVGFTVVLP